MKGFGACGPLVFKRLASYAAKVDLIVSAGQCVEACCIDDHVKLKLTLCRFDPGRCDSLDWGLA